MSSSPSEPASPKDTQSRYFGIQGDKRPTVAQTGDFKVLLGTGLFLVNLFLFKVAETLSGFPRANLKDVSEESQPSFVSLHRSIRNHRPAFLGAADSLTIPEQFLLHACR